MRITVGKKLWIGFVTIVIFLIIVGLSGLFAISKVNSEYQQLLDKNIKTVLLFEQLLSLQNEDAKNIQAYYLYRDDTYLDHRLEILSAIQDKFNALDTNLPVPSDKKILKEIKDNLFSFQQISEIVIRDVNNGEMDTALKIASEGEIYQSLATEQIQSLIQQQEKAQKTTEKELQQILIGIRAFILIMIGISVLVSVIIARLISHSIARPVSQMTTALQEIATGNLAIAHVEIRNKDEIGQMAKAFNNMVSDLSIMIRNVRQSVAQLASNAEGLSASSEESLAASEVVSTIATNNILSSKKQVNTVEESTIFIRNMVTSITQITSDNEAMQNSSDEVVRLVENGVTFMDDFSTHISTISSTIEDSTSVINDIAKHSEKIRKVTTLITDIAEQTNLLALNAAIEAARAGENGAGFAVVADEVRKLAEQSKQSASEIGQMIDMMIKNVKSAVLSANKSNLRITEGLVITENTEHTFKQINDAVKVMNQKSTTVATAINQILMMTNDVSEGLQTTQSLSLQSVLEAQSTSTVILEQLASNEEISSSSQTLAKLAETLKSDVARFTV